MRGQELEAAEDIYDIWTNNPKLKFEFLKGSNPKTYSVRLNDQWRLEFEIEWENKK